MVVENAKYKPFGIMIAVTSIVFILIIVTGWHSGVVEAECGEDGCSFNIYREVYNWLWNLTTGLIIATAVIFAQIYAKD